MISKPGFVEFHLDGQRWWSSSIRAELPLFIHFKVFERVPVHCDRCSLLDNRAQGCLQAVRGNGMSLSLCSAELRGDTTIVLAAVRIMQGRPQTQEIHMFPWGQPATHGQTRRPLWKLGSQASACHLEVWVQHHPHTKNEIPWGTSL